MPSRYGARRRRRRAAYGRGIGDFFKKIGNTVASGWNKLRDGRYLSRGLATAAQLGSAFNPALAAKAGTAAQVADTLGFGRRPVRRRKARGGIRAASARKPGSSRRPRGGIRVGDHAMVY